MFIKVDSNHYQTYAEQLKAMYELRYRIFHQRLNWVDGDTNKEERDQFDEHNPVYLINQEEDGAITACVRLLPTTGPNMLRDTFPQLLESVEPPCSDTIWESSRFAVDTERLRQYGADKLQNTTYRLFMAMVEACSGLGLTRIVTVTDMRVERIVRTTGWPNHRLGTPQYIGDTRAVALSAEISDSVWHRLKKKANVRQPVLFCPVYNLKTKKAA